MENRAMNDMKTELRRESDDYERLLGNWRMASELFLDSSASLPVAPLSGGAGTPSANKS